MSTDNEKFTLLKIRTFADDVKRARGEVVPEREDNKTKETEKKPDPKPEKDNRTIGEQINKLKPIPSKVGERNVADFLQQKVSVDVSNKTPKIAPTKKTPPPPPAKPSIKKEVAEISQKNTTKKETADVAVKNNDLVSTQVVREKRKRKGIWDIISKAFYDLLHPIKKARSQNDEGAIQSAANRADTIEKAVREGKQSPADDHAAVAERLSQIDHQTSSHSINIKDKRESQSQWTYTDEEDEMTDISKPIAPATAPISGYGDRTYEESMNAPIPQQAAETVPTSGYGDRNYEEDNRPVAADGATPEDNQADSGYKNRNSNQPLTLESEVSDTPPTAPTTVTPAPRTFAPSPDNSVSTGRRLLFLVIMIILLGALGAGGYFGYQYYQKNQNPVIEQVSTSDVPSDNVIFYPDKSTLINELAILNNESPKAITINFSDQTGVPVSKEIVAQTLVYSLDTQDLVNQIEWADFGYTANGEPFILLGSTDFDRLFAALLNWENNITEDLGPWLNITTQQLFTDIGYGSNKQQHARILQNLQEETVAAYTFINNNEVVISTNLEAVANAKVLLQK